MLFIDESRELLCLFMQVAAVQQDIEARPTKSCQIAAQQQSGVQMDMPCTCRLSMQMQARHIHVAAC